MPSDRLHFGISNELGTDLDWLVASGVPFKYRYQYLAGGINLGGTLGDPCGANSGWQTWDSPAGQYATNNMNESAAHSAIPVFTYYEIVQSNPSPGDESAELTKISTVCTMQRYWADFTVLMQKVGAYGGLVVVHVEPDFWGFMQHQSADPSTLAASVASTGNPDLAGLPDTVQGMGWAFLKLRDKYAPNALLAIHASSWASGVDIATDQRSSVNPAAEADAVVSFISKAGLVGNPTGVTPWDLIFNDVADHDAAWYGATSNSHWWDRNNVLFPNFTRWLAFMSRMHTATGLPLVEWQVPVGNQYYQTMNNTDGHYQDNRAEYFLAHPDQLTAAGIVAVLFGKANAGQTNYTDDKGDGITNPAPVSSWQCNGCNNHLSTVADDDGGFLRAAVGAYYRTFPGTTCTLFPFDNVLNTDISTLPVNTQSATWMSNMAQNANLHPDLGTVAQQYGMPINVAPPPSTGVTPTFLYNSDSDHPAEGYPIDQSTLIEGGPSAPSSSDRHALVINKSNCKLYEIFNLQNFTNGQTPSAGSGAVWDLTSNAMRPNGFTSADAAGLPITPLLLRPDEIQAGSIAHAIRFTAHCTSTYIWPASHQAGSCTTGFPPMGARFRLKSSFNISGFSPATQVVLRAFQHYGMVLADNGADWFFGGTTDDWWGTTAGSQMVSELKTIPAAQFDAVDESGLQTAAGSYQAGSAAASPRCASASLSAAPAPPQFSGTRITFTATASGCANPLFQFVMRPASQASWQTVQAYSSSPTYSWNSTGAAAGIVYFGVWAKDASSPAQYDAVTSIPFTVSTASCTSVSVAALPTSVSSGTHVTVTASATGCTNGPRYEFWLRPSTSSTWQLVQGYGASATYDWNSTGAAAGTVYLGVHMRDANSTANYDAVASTPVTVTTPSCASVSVSALPTTVTHGGGTHVTVTATAAGCTSGPRYEFWLRPATSSTWQLVQAYGTSATYDWNTTGALPGTVYLGVHVRDANSAAGYDAVASTPVTVN
ncbi:MAG: hypothetical protein E6I36_10875 [Chloroflexi bacterium]|nr:MAG: hypothetical protein E6I36_10875 [Chloroflexota bacterium]